MADKNKLTVAELLARDKRPAAKRVARATNVRAATAAAR